MGGGGEGRGMVVVFVWGSLLGKYQEYLQHPIIMSHLFCEGETKVAFAYKLVLLVFKNV